MHESTLFEDGKTPALWMALLPIVVLIILLVINVVIYKDNATYGPNQIALILAATVAGVVGRGLNVSFAIMLKGIVGGITSASGAMLILLLIGSLAGTWMISGVIPALIYYGLDVLNPQIFLFASVIVCVIVSLATGSSWSTIATVGLALIGIGKALGVSEAISAGAIISGAYFGDKMSPLSDTTNLAAAMAGANLIEHIRHMMWTTIPSISISLIIFLVIGYSGEPSDELANTAALKDAIDARFNITPILFIVPAAVLVMVFYKFDAIVALLFGTLLGAVFAVIFQPAVVTHVAGLESQVIEQSDGTTEQVQPSYAKRAYVAVINAMAEETKAVADDEVDAWETELAQLGESSGAASTSDQRRNELQGKIAAAGLMKGKGMVGMLNTIWLIVTAMCFGGAMQACGLLRRITEPLVSMAKSTGSLIATTAASCIFINTTASDQYLSIVVPGQMFKDTFEKRNLAAKNLSRTLEDAGTVTSVLIPWNTCGAAQFGVLGVATLAYAPFCFFCLLSPVMTILFGFLGIGIAKLSEPEPSKPL